MQNNENQKTYFIYVRSTGEKVPVTKEQHDSFYKEADRIRHKEQDHGRCMCPKLSVPFRWQSAPSSAGVFLDRPVPPECPSGDRHLSSVPSSWQYPV